MRILNMYFLLSMGLGLGISAPKAMASLRAPASDTQSESPVPSKRKHKGKHSSKKHRNHSKHALKKKHGKKGVAKSDAPILTPDEQNHISESGKIIKQKLREPQPKSEGLPKDDEATLVVNQLSQELSDTDEANKGTKQDLNDKNFEGSVYK